MGRAKLPIKLINSERSRNGTFNKRKKGLKKKIFEFATLCDVDACLVIYGLETGSTPETWPEDVSEVRRIVDRFEKVSKEERDKRKEDVSSFLQLKIKKLQEDLNKKRQENAELASLLLWNQPSLLAMDLNTIMEFDNLLHSKIKAVSERIEHVKRRDVEQQRQGSQTEIPSDGNYKQYLPSSGMQHLAVYIDPLQYAPSFSPTLSSLTSLPQCGYAENPFSSNSQGSMRVDRSFYGTGPDYCCYADPISGFVTGTCDNVAFPMSVQEVLDPVTSLVDHSDPIHGLDVQDYTMY